MPHQPLLAERFEAERPHLRGVAYRILGSADEADDAIQEAWIRLSRTDAEEIANLRAWLTTVVARICLNVLRSRSARRETSLELRIELPEASIAAEAAGLAGGAGGVAGGPVAGLGAGGDPEQEALLADAVGLAMLVVLDALPPAERVAFVLHDVFGVEFDAIAPVVGRTPAAARQLASRGRRRVRGAPVPDADLADQWRVVDAFLAAAREGDFARLVAVLDPDIVVRADGGAGRASLTSVVRGAEAAGAQAMSFRRFADGATRVLVDGRPGGIAWSPDGAPFAVLAFTVRGGRVAALDVIADPDRLAAVDRSLRGR